MTIIIMKLLGAIALLIYAMKVMSEALQKMAGSQLRHALGAMTTNRVTGMLTGVLVTLATQSSSATTVMTVSFVNAGLLTLAQAISVIMGANIGTTLTAWIMSAGVSFNIADFVWPAFIVGLILIQYKTRRYIGDFLFGVCFLFFALGTLSGAGKEMDLAHNEAVVQFFSSFDMNSYSTVFIFLLIGTVLTCIVQSSAALMAITMVLCTSGVLPLYLGIALVMGENIGTTLTAILAASTGNTQAKRAAMAHLMFNVFGVTWMLIVFYPFVNGVCTFLGIDPANATKDAAKLTIVLATFHTAFNVTNTFILIWFVNAMGRAVSYIVKPKADEEDEFRLHYIQGGIIRTPEISVLEAQKEIISFSERMQRMFGMVRSLLEEKDDSKFVKTFTRIEKYESISDNMEYEIGRYLERVSEAHLSDDTKGKIRRMVREIGELESIGDACYNIARSLNRKHSSKENFTEAQMEHIRQMMTLTDATLTQMNVVMSGRIDNLDINVSKNAENELNNYRKVLRKANTLDLDSHEYSYSLGTMYMDVIDECERLGDYVINVVEARFGVVKN